ncbi:HVA22-like protein a [Glycine soja]|uniref:HVA22-like protein a n=1 Tax=Glycine soja TaxID=3848 RepID=A0A445JYD3_GLYSO|nr:HVA22-like protein a [Glycine soja]
MASLWFLKLALKCLDHLAWPLLALGYPICASIQAIETNSNKETSDLISYWILLLLIYLFEYAFSRLLQW